MRNKHKKKTKSFDKKTKFRAVKKTCPYANLVSENTKNSEYNNINKTMHFHAS